MEEKDLKNEETVNISEFTSGINYENSIEKYKDNMSTAITFIICSLGGFLILGLNWFGVIKIISGKGTSAIFTYVALAVIFALFMGIGIWSVKLAQKAKANIGAEVSYNAKISDWMEENLSAEDIENSYDGSDMAEEMKYFERSAYIKKVVTAEFPEAPNEIIDTLTDEYIEETFNKED